MMGLFISSNGNILKYSFCAIAYDSVVGDTSTIYNPYLYPFPFPQFGFLLFLLP